MEIVKAATEWAKAEMISAIFFMLFGLIYLIIALSLWQWGNTALAKSLFVPLLVAGGLILAAGIGFYVSNQSKLKSFESDFKNDPTAMVKSELTRTAQTMSTYQNVALKVFPGIIIVAALLSIFVSNVTVRAIGIAIIAFFLVLVVLDSQALKRIKKYHEKLELVNLD